MDDERLRRRLEAINRGETPPRIEDAMQGAMPTEHSDVGMLPRRENMPLKKVSSSSRVVKPIPALLERGEVIRTSAGEHLRVRLPIDELWPGGSRLVAARQQHLRQLLDAQTQEADSPGALEADFAAFAAALPDRALLLDLETCGLAGAALFLVGLLRHVDGLPTVELLLARDYSEEQAILESLWDAMAAHNVLVTFNGKSFDWPMVVDRSTRHRLSARRTAGQASSGTLWQGTVGSNVRHVDVLHHARRRWREVLPDCRLQTLEELICRRRREGDLPGQMIPAAYAEYVRTGFEREMDAILFHNAVDLVTLLDLALRLAA
jgi:uncharacterized protein YprB with RNaseH-like and TPR domain